jgi:hypothetical protein
LTVPAGSYTVQGFRGPEYHRFEQKITVPAGRTAQARVALKRWTNPPARSWYGGESHIHANYSHGEWYSTPETMRLQIQGEGLHVANFVIANSTGDGVFDREFFRGKPDPVSSPQHVLYWNAEFRSTLWGHLTMYNLKRLVEPLFTGFKDTTNPWDVPTNADIADHVHLQGGHVTYTHPAKDSSDPFVTAYAARGMPIDVALGTIDSLDVNFGWPVTMELWYRLLNCGFQLPASAGTDFFLNRIRGGLPGTWRAYVLVEGPFSYEAWVAGLKAGRSFVTNGPMLAFTANGRSLGDTISLPAPGPIRVQATASAINPLTAIEVVYNGKVALTGTVAPDGLRGTVDGTVHVSRSGWLSLRALGKPEARSVTSPIYIQIADKPVASRADAEYYLQWIDRLEALLAKRNRVPSPRLRAHVEGQLNVARAVYRRIRDAAP